MPCVNVKLLMVFRWAQLRQRQRRLQSHGPGQGRVLSFLRNPSSKRKSVNGEGSSLRMVRRVAIKERLFFESVDCFMNCFHSLFAVNPSRLPRRHNSARIETLMKLIFVFLWFPICTDCNHRPLPVLGRTTQQLLSFSLCLKMPHVWPGKKPQKTRNTVFA